MSFSGLTLRSSLPASCTSGRPEDSACSINAVTQFSTGYSVAPGTDLKLGGLSTPARCGTALFTQPGLFLSRLPSVPGGWITEFTCSNNGITGDWYGAEMVSTDPVNAQTGLPIVFAGPVREN